VNLTTRFHPVMGLNVHGVVGSWRNTDFTLIERIGIRGECV
jgi:hypothetical protein